MRLRDESDEHELSVGFGTGGDGAQPVKRMTADGAPVERLLDVELSAAGRASSFPIGSS